MPNAPCYRGGNQSGLHHGLQSAGDGMGWRKRRITRLPRTSTSVCVGGGVRQPALGKYVEVRHGGRGQADDGGVPGWDGG